jgi:hypothetical protein
MTDALRATLTQRKPGETVCEIPERFVISPHTVKYSDVKIIIEKELALGETAYEHPHTRQPCYCAIACSSCCSSRLCIVPTMQVLCFWFSTKARTRTRSGSLTGVMRTLRASVQCAVRAHARQR